MENYGEEKKASFWWGVLGFFFPLIGLILYIVWNKTEPEKAKKVGIGALIGFLSGLFMPFILMFTMMFLIGSGNIESLINKMNCYSYGTNYEPYEVDGEWMCKNKINGKIIDPYEDSELDLEEEEDDSELEEKIDSLINKTKEEFYNNELTDDEDEDFDEDDDEAFEKCVKAHNGMHASDKSRFKYNITLDKYAKLYKAVTLDESKKLNDDFVLLTVSENEKYGDDEEYIIIKDGTVTMHTRGKDYKANVKNAKYFYEENNGEYVHNFAILTSDGDLYIGSDLDDLESEEYEFNPKAFNSLKKVSSNNKYKDLSIVLFDNNCHEKYWEGDSYPYEFVGITTDGKMDLLD